MTKKFTIPTFGDLSFEIDFFGHDKSKLLRLYEKLFKIREFERVCAQKKKDGFIGGPVHLAIGQEAIPVGISENINSTDFVFSAHRSHAHILALGTDMASLFSELSGKAGGQSGGFGGSMHLVDQEVGFYGSVPIVAGTVPLALGAAFAAKYRHSDSISVSYFGDGALEEGVVQETLNLASIMDLPILFICENNLMASHMHISQRQKLQDLTRFATANGIASKRLDGNNVVELANEFKKITEEIRTTKKPFFVEAITYRQLGHVDWREDIDVGVDRSLDELTKWKTFDPIIRLRNSLIEEFSGILSEIEKIEDSVKTNVRAAWELSLNDSIPDEHGILNLVLAKDVQSKND